MMVFYSKLINLSCRRVIKFYAAKMSLRCEANFLSNTCAWKLNILWGTYWKLRQAKSASDVSHQTSLPVSMYSASRRSYDYILSLYEKKTLSTHLPKIREFSCLDSINVSLSNYLEIYCTFCMLNLKCNGFTVFELSAFKKCTFICFENFQR